MKLLFDQNISYRIEKMLPIGFNESTHLSNLGLVNRNDQAIWQYAKDNGFSIVTFDADFYEISLLKGCPPKIIWIRAGNLTTSSIAELLTINIDSIFSFIENNSQPNETCLEIFCK